MHRTFAATLWAILAAAALVAACSEPSSTTGTKSGRAKLEDVKQTEDLGVAVDVAAVDGGGTADVGLDAAVDAAPDADLGADATVTYATPPAKLGAPTQFFDPFGIHAIHLTLDPANWTAYLDGAAQPDGQKVYDWYLATVTIDEVPFSNLGIRGFGNGSQINNPKKPNIRLKFDQFNLSGVGPAGEQSFRLKAAGQDGTFLREPIAYELVRSIGGYAPRWSWALVTVNGVNYGFYQLFETTDKRMFKALFGNNDGHKYESAVGCVGFNCPWGDCAKIPNAYKLDPGDGSELAALATAITTATDDQFEATVGAIIDLDALLAAYANDAVLSNLDGIASSGQNYTLYVNKTTGKIELIQTGTDLTFGNFGDAWYDLMAPWGPPNSWCPGRIDWMFKRITQIPALKQKLLAKMRALQCGAFGAGKLVPLLGTYQELLHKYVYQDPLSPYSATDLDKWYAAMQAYVTQRSDALKVLFGPCL